MRRKKGFTLIEMVIVISIIAVLTAVIVPAWISYIRKGRLKTQNNQARAIYTSAQTLIQEYKFQERKTKDETKCNVGTHAFDFYWDGGTGTATIGRTKLETWQNTTVSKFAAPTSQFLSKFGTQLNSLSGADGDVVYRVYVEDYIVRAVVSGRYDNDRYLGSYPTRNDDVLKDQPSNHVSQYDVEKVMVLTAQEAAAKASP